MEEFFLKVGDIFFRRKGVFFLDKSGVFFGNSGLFVVLYIFSLYVLLICCLKVIFVVKNIVVIIFGLVGILFLYCFGVFKEKIYKFSVLE